MTFINFSKNPVPVHCLTSNQNLPNMRFELDILIQEKGGINYQNVLTLKGVPDPAGNFVFNVQKVLNAFLAPDLPAFNQTTISQAPGMFRRWRGTIKEWYGEPVPTMQSQTQTPVNFVLLGGLNFLGFPGNSYFNDSATNGRFLTDQPNGKKVLPGQQEFLYYLTANQNWSSIYLQRQVYYEDGSSASLPPVLYGAPQEGVYIIPAGFNQLGIGAANPAKTVLKYEVWLTKSSSPGGAGSEKRTYFLDFGYYKHSRYFIYQNSKGAFESLACTGKFEDFVEVSSQEGERLAPVQYSAADSQYFRYNTSYRDTFKANTGHITNEYKRHLKEFLLSENIFEAVAGRFVRIRLKTDKAALVKDFDYLNSLDFEYSYAHENPAYSK